MSTSEIQAIQRELTKLQDAMNALIPQIHEIQIANRMLLPLGWRKAAKGRTVWRIVEEVISQNLEVKSGELGFDYIRPADSEVGVYDFSYSIAGLSESFVNIKSAVSGTRSSKDDISKAASLISHYETNPESNLFIATFILSFTDTPSVRIEDCVVMPLSWIPDVYVNPSNNGNVQSAYAKNINKAVFRTNSQFVDELRSQMEVARQKKMAR